MIELLGNLISVARALSRPSPPCGSCCLGHSFFVRYRKETQVYCQAQETAPSHDSLQPALLICLCLTGSRAPQANFQDRTRVRVRAGDSNGIPDRRMASLTNTFASAE